MDNNLGQNRRKITPPPPISQIKGAKIAHFGFRGALSLISRGLEFVVHFRPTVDLLR